MIGDAIGGDLSASADEQALFSFHNGPAHTESATNRCAPGLNY